MTIQFTRASVLLATMIFFGAGQLTRAAETWDGGTGSWDDPGNWTPFGPPLATDDFFINNGGTAQVTTGISALGRIGTLAEGVGQSGTIQISGGSLTLSGALRIGYGGTGNVTISGSGAVTALEVELGSLLTGTGTLNLNGGSLTTANVMAGSNTATFSIDGGTLRLSQDQAALFGGFAEDQVIFAAGGATIDTQEYDGTTTADLTGLGTLQKAGSGKLILTGNSDFAGPTTVQEGTLVVDGFIASSVTVNDGASFGGDGTVGGAVILEDGAMLVPIDCFDTGDDVTWNAGAGMTYHLAASGESDILEIGGNLNKASTGSFAFTFQDAGWEVGSEYLLIVFSDTGFTAGDFSFTNDGGFDGFFTREDTTISFTLTAIPEPTAITLAALGLIVIAARRKRSA